VLHLRIHKGLLYCTYCRGPLRPNDCMRKPWMVGEMRSTQSFC
jgi:hypothetical protein